MAEAVEHPAGITVEAATAPHKPRGSVEDLPVDVELELAVGVVADTHRARAGVAF
jgi:hypothetical protein